jgi:hypothetical protein
LASEKKVLFIDRAKKEYVSYRNDLTSSKSELENSSIFVDLLDKLINSGTGRIVILAVFSFMKMLELFLFEVIYGLFFLFFSFGSSKK